MLNQRHPENLLPIGNDGTGNVSRKIREEYENLLRQFVFINRLISVLLSSSDVDEMLEKIVSGIHQTLSIERVGFLCLRQGEDLLQGQFASGIEAESRERLQIPIHECSWILLNAARHKSSFFSRVESAALKRLLYRSLGEEERDSLFFPIFSYRGEGCLLNRSEAFLKISHEFSRNGAHRGKKEDYAIGEECLTCKYFPLLGILWMDNRSSGHPFHHELITLYTLLLNMDIAAENRILMRELKEVSIKDGLTGAFNKSYLISILEKEVERASRQGNSLSIAMMDLDDFKRINDSYGHQFGDKCLQIFATFVQNSIRKMDYFCRFGGDEFVIVLPGASADQSANVVNRLVERLKNERVSIGGTSLTMQISTGIATYPDMAKNAEEILNCSDRALYDAKKR
ncbi:MAG: GGDEF domain-containing protein, partial [Acidobacteriota bacterium]